MAKTTERRRDTLVGLFVLASLTAAMVMIVLLGSEQGIFRPRSELRAVFSNVSGLRAGAPVFVAGLNVGSVRELRFAPPAAESGEAARVEVIVLIDDRYRSQIREDSVATVGSIGLLGDKSIEISVGSLESPEVEAGTELRTEEPVGLAEVLEELQPMARKLDVILQDIAAVTGNVAGSESPLMQSIDNLSSILRKVDQGQGTVGRLVNSEQTAEELDQVLREASALLSETTGAVVEVRRATADLPATMESVRAVAADVEELAVALRESSSNLPLITEDVAVAAANIRAASGNLPSIAASANRGVRRANEVVDAAGRTIFLRGALSEEKGALPANTSADFPRPGDADGS